MFAPGVRCALPASAAPGRFAYGTSEPAQTLDSLGSEGVPPLLMTQEFLQAAGPVATPYEWPTEAGPIARGRQTVR